LAESGGTGNVTVNVATNATISTSTGSAGLFGIDAFSLDTGNITVSMLAGDFVTSGSVGVIAVSWAATDPTSSAITVTAAGTIDSGPNTQDGGFPSAGILAGYNPNNAETPDSDVAGNVSVTSDATINAAGGYGIEAFNFGTGNATVTTEADSSITASGSPIDTPDGIVPPIGIAAFAFDGGNANITNAGTVIASAGIAILAEAYGVGTATVDNSGTITGAVELSNATFDNETGGVWNDTGISSVSGTNIINNLGTINDVGSVSGTGSTGAILDFTNSGNIVQEVDSTVLVGFTSESNSGTITMDAGATASISILGSWSNSGTITLDDGATFSLSIGTDATNEAGGVISAAVGSSVTIAGSSSFTNDGTLEANGGTLIINTDVSGTGSETISNSGFMEFQSSVSAGQTITFADATGTLAFADPAASASNNPSVAGLTDGDTIDLTNIAPSSIESATIDGSTLVVQETAGAGGASFSFNIAGSLTDNYFNVQGDGASGTDLVLAPILGQNLVVNGGFETGDLTGWTPGGDLSQPQYDQVTTAEPHSGTYALEIGVIGDEYDVDQDIPTAPGATYQVQFWLANGGGTPSNFTASFGAITLLSLNDTSAQGYTEYTYDVTATSSSTELLFVGRQDPSFWYLDDVSVVGVSDVDPALVPGTSNVVGNIAVADSNPADTVSASFTPEGANYAGTFSLDPVTESNGVASVGFEFNLGNDQINLAPEQTLTQSYAVAVTDPQNPAVNVNQTVSVSIGGPGNDNFVFAPGVGADTIVNFNPQADTIELDHFANIQNIQQLASQISTDVHGDAVIELGHNDSITIPGTTASYLQAHLQSLVHLH
jgi:hypothetical protein